MQKHKRSMIVCSGYYKCSLKIQERGEAELELRPEGKSWSVIHGRQTGGLLPDNSTSGFAGLKSLSPFSVQA